MKNNLFKKIFDLFLFTSLYIALCAAVMIYQTYFLFIQKPLNFTYLSFVFASSICSYNFHWLLTSKSVNPSYRICWTDKHKWLHLFLFLSGFCASICFFFLLPKDWPWLGIAAVLTFLYSAPKISLAPFQWLKKFAYGKTIFLAMVWTYVTAVLPFFIENKPFTTQSVLFFSGQYFFLYAVCILFDYRDRQDDKAEGIRSMITFFSEKGINILFTISIILSVIFFLLLVNENVLLKNILVLLIPVIITAFLYNYAKKNFSDYFYYFILDGLLMLAGILLWIMNCF